MTVFGILERDNMMEERTENETVIKLKGETELRFVVDNPGDRCLIEIIEGSAEIFGSQLLIGKEYAFSYFSSVAIFTWNGCTIKLYCENKIYIIKRSKQVKEMKNVHEYLENFRDHGQTRDIIGPITLITGPTDVGKSTLSRFLLNYAVRGNHKPIYVDLDVGQGSVSVTGTLCVTQVNDQSNVFGKFSEDALSVYFFGYKSPGHNMQLYNLLLEKLGRTLKNRLNQSAKVIQHSGVIIDTCGWVDGPGYNLILKIIELFRVSVVLVLGERSLYSSLQKNLSQEIELRFVKKLNGVFTRNRTVRIDNRDSCVLEYFYGPTGNLKPFIVEMKISDFYVFKAEVCKSDHGNRELIVTHVPIDHDILYQIFALSYAENADEILLSSVFGFVCLIELKMEKESVAFLSPNPGPLPTKHLLMGDIKISPSFLNIC